MYLHVRKAGAILTRRAHRLAVVVDDQIVADVSPYGLDAVILWGTNATIPALRLLLNNDVPLVLLDAAGRYKGRLEPPWSKNVHLRDRQRGAFRSQHLTVARELVTAKIYNQRLLLDRWSRRGLTAVRPVLHRLRAALEAAARAPDLGALRGIEGTAAREYFAAANLVLPKGFTRTRRPPADVYNAALSYGYAVLRERCIAAAATVGFDIYVGIYHGRKYGRPALALDLMEPYRPVIDRLVFGMVRRGEIGPKLERREDGGAYLTSEGAQVLLDRLATLMERPVDYLGRRRPLALTIFEQARILAHSVEGRGAFLAFRMARD
ncbi:MAG: CRISPR-associated endonuclease Cas1 [Acidobacterium ailaaui]|nr:CRISPR-associated endonuclease Cas1 [Pseudacidobacterium ailaaui]